MDNATLTFFGIVFANAVAIYAVIAGRQRQTAEASIIEKLQDALDSEIDKRRAVEKRLENEIVKRRESDAKISGMEKMLSDVMRELEYYKLGTQRLVRQLRRHKIEPEWTPDELAKDV